MLLRLSVPASHDRGPLGTEQFLTTFHEADVKRQGIDLIIANHGRMTGLFIRCSSSLKPVVERQIYAAYPEAKLVELKEDALAPATGTTTWSAGLWLDPDLFPSKNHRQFLDTDRSLADPLTALLGAIEPESARTQCVMTLSLRPARSRDVHRAKKVIDGLSRSGLWKRPSLATLYVTGSRLNLWPIRRLVTLMPYLFSKGRPSPEVFTLAKEKFSLPLFTARVTLTVAATPKAADAAEQRLEAMASSFALFSEPHAAGFERGKISKRHRPERAFLFSAREAATLWHPPSSVVPSSPTLDIVTSREFPPPPNLPKLSAVPSLTVIGTTHFRGQRQRFGILPDDRLRHAIVLGKTGMGKSTLLQHLIASDLTAGRGMALVDPHGDLTEAVLKSVPRSRSNDVILFDAADAEFPVAFNVLACADPGQRPLLASGVLAAFKKLFGDSWGPRLEHILRNALLTLLETPEATLVSLLRLLGDARERQRIVSKISDPVVRGFWEHEFNSWAPKFQAEAVAPVQNKVGHFVSSPLLRNIVGQPANRLNLRSVLDDGRILLVNLSKGRLGEDASGLLGSLLITCLQLAAMSRADIPEDRRRPFFLYVDEFQNFATESFATILSESRKYRLGLTLAHQYLDQLDDATRSAVFGNVGSMITFQVGADDAEAIAEQLGADAQSADLLQLPKHTALIRLLIDGMPSRPFTMRTLPPPSGHSERERANIIRALSRRRYARPRRQVEEEVERQYVHG